MNKVLKRKVNDTFYLACMIKYKYMYVFELYEEGERSKGRKLR